MADTFTVGANDRDGWYDDAAAAVVALNADVRAQVAKRLTGGIPARYRTLFRQSWWDQAVDRHVTPAFSTIAADSVDDLADSLSVDVDPDRRAAAGAGSLGGVLGLLDQRYVTVRDRTKALHAQARREGWDPDDLAEALGIGDDDPSGVLSDASGDSIGRSLATLLIEATAVYALNALTSDTVTATKTWRTVGDDRVRPDHADADGQTVGVDEPFAIGGFDAMFPGDPDLPGDLAINCRCLLEYSVDVGDVALDLEEEEAMAASAGLRAPTSAVFAVDGARVTVTVEPTAAEKQALAVYADVPAELHVPLLDVGDVASFTPDARTALAGVLATVAAGTPPLSGQIAGTGYLDEGGVTVGIVDCPGLGALRDLIADALYDMAPEPGEFIPAVVLTAGSVDVSTVAATPVHFNELRVHVGAAETLVFDLLGPIETAPDTAVPEEETPPAPAEDTPVENPPAEAPAMTTSTTARLTFGADTGTGTVSVPAGWRLVPASATFAPGDMPADAMPADDSSTAAPPAPALADATDEDIETEIARRAAEQVAADTGGAVDDLMATALEEVSGIVAEIVAELETEDGAGDGETEPIPPAPAAVAAADGHATLAAGGEAGLPLADRDATWDAAAADGRVSKLASSDGSGDPDTIDFGEYGRAFLWHAPNPTAKGDFKLGFADVVNGQLQAVPKGIFAVAAVLQGGRGGADIPPGDVDTIKSKLNSYYSAMADKFGDDSIVPPWDTAVATRDTLAGGLLAPDVNGDGIGEAPQAVDYEWEGILAIEGVPTSDGRMFAEGALIWRTLPLTLALQTVTAPGHDGAVVCGSICEIVRDGNNIIGRGRFSGTEAGDLARTLIGEGSLHGVSIDVASAVVVYTDENGDDLDPVDVGFGEPAVAVFVQAEMMAATLTPFPAFADARVDLIDVSATSLVATGAPGGWRLTGPAFFTLLDGTNTTEALVASAAPTVPAPPGHLFALKPDTRQPFTVGTALADGTIPVYGLLADWNIPHIGFDGRKVYPPRGDDFAMFYTGKHVVTREGDRIPTGPIFVDTVHPNLALNASDAQAWYAHDGAAVADVHLYNAEHGIVAAGVLRPGTDELKEYRFRGSDVSPDWRPTQGGYRMIAICAVNASGFPVPYIEGIAASAGRFRSYVAYDDTTGEPLAMVAVGAPVRERRPADVIATLQAQVEDGARRLTALETRQAAPPGPVEPVVDDGPVELSAGERAERARTAMAAMGLDRESRARRARTTLGLVESRR